jgi:hypothetical protein
MASKEELSSWFDNGVSQGATHLIVVSDTFSHEDYPVFCEGAAHTLDRYKHYDGRNMQRVMEVYDLGADKAEQFKLARVMRLPKGPS